MDLRTFYSLMQTKSVFITKNAGDTEDFRYPHLAFMQKNFTYEPEQKYWRFTPKTDGSSAVSEAKAFAMEDITIYEFLTPAARKLHLYDMTSVPYSDEDRETAFQEVNKLYQEKEKSFPAAEIKTVSPGALNAANGFGYIKELYREIDDITINVLTLKNVQKFPFGSVLKGTDLLITDGTLVNFGQDILHMLYHLKEGIPGMNNGNCSVKEVWAPVPALYAMQLCDGRISRRKRNGPSPHLIHFTDYIYLRAYLGQAFIPDNTEETFHPAYSIIEPSIQPMMYAMRNKSAYDRNRIFADAVLEDNPEELISVFEDTFGAASFAAVYGTYSLYEKYDLLTRFISPEKADEIFFERPQILPSSCSPELIREIWKKPEKRYENIAVLSTCK